MHIIFETPRLIFRQFTGADALLVLSLNSDPEIVKYVHGPTLKTVKQSEKILQDIILPQYKNNLGRWAIHIEDECKAMLQPANPNNLLKQKNNVRNIS